MEKMTAARTIMFRGKDTCTGEWVFGTVVFPCSVKNEIYTAIIPMIGNESVLPEIREVDDSTLGQYTGILDKNGRMIFEGDVLEYESNLVSSNGFAVGGKAVERRVVIWDSHKWAVKTIYSSRWTESYQNYGHKCDLYADLTCSYATVVGNIHDNPETHFSSLGGN